MVLSAFAFVQDIALSKGKGNYVSAKQSFKKPEFEKNVS